MSRFYVSGSNERAPKGSYKKGGRKELNAHLRGWNIGVMVEASVVDGLDTFKIYSTNGTNNPDKLKLIKTLVDRESAGPRNPKGQLK